MKCTKCKIEQTEDKFAWKIKSKQIRQTQCKSCHSERSKIHYRANKAKYIEQNNRRHKESREYIKSQKQCCVICNETWLGALVFHHVNPSTKRRELSRFGNYGKRQIMLEIKKCIVLCHNCHAKYHTGHLDVYVAVERFIRM